MRSKLNLLFLFAILLVLPFSFAKPIIDPIVSQGVDTLEVEVPIVSVIKQFQDGVTLHTHVHNKTSGLPLTPDNSDVSCYLHMYNVTGGELLEEEMIPDPNNLEWELDINKENFSLIGIHSFFLFCNNSVMGGFVRGGFEVTATGIETEEGGVALGIIILIPIFITLLLFLFAYMIPVEKYWALKLTLPLFGLFFIFQAYQYGVIIISETVESPTLINAIADNAFIYGMVIWILIAVLLITFIYDIFMMFDKKKHKTGKYP